MSKKEVYFTTPIYYVNDKPHVGHAYTTILCDTFSRFNRFCGKKTYFLTGTDEHGEKIFKAAAEKGVQPIEHIDSVVPRFKELWKALGIENDDFIRTTEKRHTEVVQRVLTKLYEEGAIYLGKYTGWYCVPCETFWTENQLMEGSCPECSREVQEIEEDNYFFKMTDHQEWLIHQIKSNPGFLHPKSKEKEVLSFLKEPLEDLCISRPKERLSWGIPIPFDENHVLYVWFDALLNYLSAIGYLVDEDKFRAKWPADIHFMAKDILRHHGVYWPIMLHVLGLEMPKCILAHGFWTMEGEKMSKSKGNIADPYDIMNVYGNDTLRYFLLRAVTLGADGGYAEEYVVERFNSDLANDLGNLVHRSFSMLEKYTQGVVPKYQGKLPFEKIEVIAGNLAGGIQAAMALDGKRDPRSALDCIWELVSLTNKIIEETKPWALAKEDSKKEELGDFLYALLESIRVIGISLKPFLPETSKKILEMFQIDFEKVFFDDLKWGELKEGIQLKKGEPLFPRVET